MDDITLFETEGRMRYNSILSETDALRLGTYYKSRAVLEAASAATGATARLISSLQNWLDRMMAEHSHITKRMANYDGAQMGYRDGVRSLR